MLQLRGNMGSRSGSPNRRGFLKLGSLGLTGLSLPHLLASRQAQGANGAGDKSVILVWMTGGPSHIDTYDLKPEQPAEIRGPFGQIPTNLSGFAVSDHLPGHTRIADKLAIVRSFQHMYGVHDDAQHLVQTGHPLLNARQRGQQHPAQGAVVSAVKGANQAGMPAYVCIPEDYRSHQGFYQAAAYLGPQHNALNGGGDPSLGNYRLPEFVLPADLSLARLNARRGLLPLVDGFARNADQSDAVRAMDDIQKQAFNLITGSKARTAFDLTQEPEELRKKYGEHAYGQSALLARRLVEAGVTFVTVNLYEKDVDWWDDHYTIEKNLRKRLPPYDQALTTLIEDLHERGLSDQVLVVACGEFGRAPRIDSNAGRGHWPRAMTAVLSGGGIKGGQVIGSTTADGGEPASRPLVPGDLLATIYKVLDINPDLYVPDLQKRPVPIVPEGEPIAELF